jgi:carbonic anhydrase
MVNQILRKLDEILAYNNHFVESKEYEHYLTNRYPNKRMVILTCMDTRLTELLPRALNLRNGDAKIIKNAGAIVIQPFGNVMRSILVALYKLSAEEVFVIGHHDCGMTGLNAEMIVESAIERGVDQQMLTTLKRAGIDLRRWLRGFDDVHDGVKRSVEIIRNHPLLPPGTAVHGLLIHPETGKLDVIINGYEHLSQEQLDD